MQVSDKGELDEIREIGPPLSARVEPAAWIKGWPSGWTYPPRLTNPCRKCGRRASPQRPLFTAKLGFHFREGYDPIRRLHVVDDRGGKGVSAQRHAVALALGECLPVEGSLVDQPDEEDLA